MEMRRWIYYIRILATLAAVLASPLYTQAQEPAGKYKIKHGKMQLEISADVTPAGLDSFTRQFNLQGIGLSGFFLGGSFDSLKTQGWTFENNGKGLYIFTKPLVNLANLDDPGARIIFTGKDNIEQDFFYTGGPVVYGTNKLKKKTFTVSGDTVQFFLRGYNKAGKVVLAGNFNNWSPDALPMTRTDSGWIARVVLKPGKYWYKFIADGEWFTDPDNSARENDGNGNMNSVYYQPNHIFRLNPAKEYKRVYVSGSFNNWKEKELLMTNVNGQWQLPVFLSNGTHTYRFIADGDWFVDPANPVKVPNSFNDYNSVITLGQSRIFELKGYTNASKVMLTGDFNGWKEYELVMIKTDSGWRLPYALGSGNYEYAFLVDGKKVDAGGRNFFLVLDPNYTFRLKGYAAAKQVFLSGTFNNWVQDNIPMQKDGDDWIYALHLAPGKVLYKFVVDGNWIVDPANTQWEQNEYGTGNSVLWIENK